MATGQLSVQVPLSLLLRYVAFVSLLVAGLVGVLLERAGAGVGGLGGWEWAAALALGALVALLLHEGVHAAAALLLGGSRVRLGLLKLKSKLLVVGAYVKVEKPLPLARWLIVALAPLSLSAVFYMLIPLSGLPGAVALAAFWLNTVGASGDIVFSIIASSAGRRVLVHDLGDRLVIIGGKPHVAALLILDAICVFILSYLAVGSFSFFAAALTKSDITLAGLPLASFERTDRGFALAVKHGSLILALILTAVFEAAFGIKRAKRSLDRLAAA